MNATPAKSSSTKKPTIEAPPPLALITLADLTPAERIGELHRAGIKNREELRTLLTKAKQDAGPGGWTTWLADNREVLGFGERQAQIYLLSEANHASALAARAEQAREVRRLAKERKPKATEAERLAVKDGTAVINADGKVVSLVRPCDVPGCEERVSEVLVGCGHGLCEDHEQNCSDEDPVCAACARKETVEPDFEDVKARADAAGYDLVRLDPPLGTCHYRLTKRSDRKQPRSWSRWTYRSLDEIVRHLVIEPEVDDGEMTDEEVRIQEAKERDNSLASTVWAIGRELDEVEENVQYLTPQSVASLKDTHRRIGKLIERAEAAKRP